MRISVEAGDPGYCSAAFRCKVYLAGAERSNVLTADEEQRYAKTVRLDANGHAVMKDGEIQTDEFWGDVRIEVR